MIPPALFEASVMALTWLIGVPWNIIPSVRKIRFTTSSDKFRPLLTITECIM